MALFFISSPIGILQITLKGKKLYSISKISKRKKLYGRRLFENELLNSNKTQNTVKYKKNSEKKTDFKKIIDKNLSCFLDQDFLIKKSSEFAKNIKQQLTLYFEGDLKKFNIPLYRQGTDFQQKVWKALKQIPWGKSKSYGQIAQGIQKPKAFRAVGNACANNPFLIVVPCHRVLSHKNLGGFALGLKAKRQLLKLEDNISGFTLL